MVSYVITAPTCVMDRDFKVTSFASDTSLWTSPRLTSHVPTLWSPVVGKGVLELPLGQVGVRDIVESIAGQWSVLEVGWGGKEVEELIKPYKKVWRTIKEVELGKQV